MQQHSGSECDSCSFASPKMHITALAKDHLLLIPESIAGFGNVTEWARPFLLSTMLAIGTCDMLGFRLNVSPQKSTQVLRIQSDRLWHSINVRGLPLLLCSVKKEKQKKKKRYTHMSSVLMHFHAQSALSAFTQKFSVENSQRGDVQQSKLSLWSGRST